MNALHEDQHILDLIKRATCGDAVATTVLLTRYDARLQVLVEVRIPARWRSIVDVDDVLQEVRIDAFRNLGTFEERGPDSFYRWVATIALRRLRNRIRNERTAKRGGAFGRLGASVGNDQSIVCLLDLMSAPEKSPSHRARSQEAVNALQEGIRMLPDDYRQAVQLVYLDGVSPAEAGLAMGRTTRAVHNLCHKAKLHLLDQLGSRSLFLSDH